MLDVFCSKLSDEAQLKIALRLGKLTLRVWTTHLGRHPADLDKLSALVAASKRVTGGARHIDFNFPERALEKIERSYAAAKAQSPSRPIPIMKGDATLSPLLATCMQPLTNPDWDNTLTQSVRLVFTMVFNILVWILHRRTTPDGETHIYVAINHAADVLLRESILTVPQIDEILYEYQAETRGTDEDSAWETSFRAGGTEPLDQEDIYNRILGEKMVKDQCGPALAKEVLRQMRDEGKSFSDRWDEYLTGTSKTYAYNKTDQTFYRNEFDSIVGSFSNDIVMSEAEMLSFISKTPLSDLRESGFEV